MDALVVNIRFEHLVSSNRRINNYYFTSIRKYHDYYRNKSLGIIILYNLQIKQLSTHRQSTSDIILL